MIAHPLLEKIAADFSGTLAQRSGKSDFAPEGIFDDFLLKRFCASNRHYHDLIRLMEMFEAIEDNDLRFQRPQQAKMALVLRDAFYAPHHHRPGTPTGQRKKEIRTFLDILAVEPEFADEVCNLVEVTDPPYIDSTDQQLMVDLDMIAVGEERRRYNEYAIGTAKELLPVFGEQAYTQARLSFLSELIQGNRVFETDYFEAKFGLKAKDNALWEQENLPIIIAQTQMLPSVSALYSRKPATRNLS